MERAAHRKIVLPVIIITVLLLAIGLVVRQHRSFPSWDGPDLSLDALYFISTLVHDEHAKPYQSDVQLNMEMLLDNPEAQKALSDLRSHEECGQILVRTPLRTTADTIVNMDRIYDVLLVIYKSSTTKSDSPWGLMVDNVLRTREIYSDPRNDSMTFIPIDPYLPPSDE